MLILCILFVIIAGFCTIDLTELYITKKNPDLQFSLRKKYIIVFVVATILALILLRYECGNLKKFLGGVFLIIAFIVICVIISVTHLSDTKKREGSK